jgi:5'-methylthioadenosine phosphorylase
VESGAVHVPFADPYCPRLTTALGATGSVAVGGTMVVVEGPRFSTRAESRHYAAQGWSLINMTGHPEAVLARELGVCYAAVALVTDMDAGVESGDGVGQDEVFAMFERNVERLKALLLGVVADLPDPAGCSCNTWSDGLELTYDVPGAGAR